MSDQVSLSAFGLSGARPAAEPVAAERGSVEARRPAEEAARAFEAAFLADMLKHAGFGEAPDGFGGGAGEEQFAGFLREAQAREMAAAGGIGIAEYVMRHLVEGRNGEVGHDAGT